MRHHVSGNRQGNPPPSTIHVFFMRRGLFPLATLLCLFGSTSAQQSPGTILLKEGTDVKLKFAEEVSSKTATVDDPVALTLDEDIKVGDVVVVKAGAKALALVSNVKKAGMMGKGGELNIRLDYLKADSVKIKLRGTKARQGEDKTTSAIVLTVLLGPVGLIKHGKDVEIKPGVQVAAFVADDIVLPPAP
jgi:hypothetical protein